MIAFGPIPSRRFGKSLGINNIPPHICSFCCVYCQVGKTTRMAIERESFYPPETVFEEVKRRVDDLKAQGESVDYLTFVPDGEPTLDKNLGKTIELLKSLNIKLAVVTNSTLLWDKNVRRDLENVDSVSVKVDAVTEDIWKKLNRPHGGLELATILDGILQFRKNFKGRVTSETMLINGINDKPESVRSVAGFLKRVQPHTVYLALPTRPPAESGIHPAREEQIDAAIKIFKSTGFQVKCLFEELTRGFGHTKSVTDDILGITSVHPMEETVLRNFVKEINSDWDVVEGLVHTGKLTKLDYDGKRFYKS